jgi:hypothetical protein
LKPHDLVALLMLLQAYILRRNNAQRQIAIANGALDQPELGDHNPHFK